MSLACLVCLCWYQPRHAQVLYEKLHRQVAKTYFTPISRPISPILKVKLTFSSHRPETDYPQIGARHAGKIAIVSPAWKKKIGTLRSDDGDSKENFKNTIGLVSKTTIFARASRFFVHFFAVTARLQRENA